jgi:hypothetical protein
MPAKAEVTVKTGLPGSVTGVSITYQVGSIPYATVDLITEGGATLFGNLEQDKRKPYDIEVSCVVHSGQDSQTRKLKFEGLLDGLSVSSSVGRSHFQAVLKAKTQKLLELTTLTPGLYPSSINIYKMPNFSVVASGDMVESWGVFDEDGKLPYDKEPIVFYTELLKTIMEVQSGDFQKFLGVEPLLDKSKPYQKIYNDGRYKKAAKEAFEIFDEKLDISAVTGGGAAAAGVPSIFDSIQHMFLNGPNVLLENYMNFLAQMGCSLIFGNTKVWAVPMNTVIKPNGGSPEGGGKLQSQPNAAGPADCIAYSYNDVGYRDIACVIVQGENLAGGVDIGVPAFTRDHLAHFIEEEGTSQASGVLVVKNHPWMAAFPTKAAPADAQETKEKLDQPGESMYAEKKSFGDGVDEAKEVAEESEKKKEAIEDAAGEVLNNYAFTKYLQARYGDRQGSITLDFNPKWVPGTGGTLYIREISTTLSFYVTSVTHHIDVTPPNAGTAITTISFTCGRSGKGPQGAEEDKFLNYNAGKESGVQKAFIKDIGAD